MYNRSRYGRNGWYVAFFWAFIGFVLGQLTPPIRFSLGSRAQLPPPIQTAPTANSPIATGDFQ